ncbi:2EXR domain-containing protein [Fusarium sp. Ph1]|nr:2EXR domain-containing protein [Fusarium sp. Ph1]
MPETFHLFPRLPAELRLAIWKLALHPGGKTLPGVHFFGIVQPEEDEDAASLMDQTVPLPAWHNYRNYELVGPRWMTMPTEDRFVGMKQEPASWTDNNPSTYLIDSGLWLACRESRRDIQQAFLAYCWKKPLIYSNDAQRPKSSKGRFIAVFPGRDLFCCQPYDWYNLGLFGGFADFLLVIFHGHVRNVGVEYNPQWGVEVEKAEGDGQHRRILQTFFDLAIGSASLSQIESAWFIDYRIRRRHHVPTKEQSEAPFGEVFYQDGRRLVEVDIECEDSPWEQSYEAAEDQWTSCKTFVLALRQMCQDNIDHEEPVYHLWDESAPVLRVLACEDY